MSQEILEDKIRERYEKITRRRRFQLRLLRNWNLIAVLILAIYVGLPMSAPVLMEVGAEAPADVIYDVYQFACHQFAFRSIFLFGDQTFYPREEADVSGLDTFEERAIHSEEFIRLYRERFNATPEQLPVEQISRDLEVWEDEAQWPWAAREFRGDEEIGYKMAICQRDIAIYFAMVVFGIYYGFVKHRLRPVPLWLYVLLGLGPIGIDGFGQLFSYPPFELWNPSETTPYFRILTGALFGMMNIWLAFPYLNNSFEENAESIERELSYRERELDNMLDQVRSTSTQS